MKTTYDPEADGFGATSRVSAISAESGAKRLRASGAHPAASRATAAG